MYSFRNSSGQTRSSSLFISTNQRRKPSAVGLKIYLIYLRLDKAQLINSINIDSLLLLIRESYNNHASHCNARAFF
jgi:hypothetical protein